MGAADPCTVIAAKDRRKDTTPTPGMVREQAIASDRVWAGLTRTAPKMASGWHHHADYETAIYVVSGRLRMESGRGGTSVVEAGSGDFVHVPRGAIHRESNPDATEATLVVVRSGAGAPVVNVEGPATS